MGRDDHSDDRSATVAAPADAAADVVLLEDILGSVRLYIDWYYVTKQLTTVEKDRFADAVEAFSERLHPGDGAVVERWWRDPELLAERRRAQLAQHTPAPVTATAPTFGRRGPCAFCGHADARHRSVDAWVELVAAGESPQTVAAEFGVPLEWVEIAVLAAGSST